MRLKSANQRVYRKFAGVYDRLSADLFSVEMAQKTFDLLEQFEIEVENCLDLCCGTGTAIKVFSEAGYSNSEIKRLLRETGFRVQGLYNCRTMGRPNRETNRICVIAQKL